MFSRVLRAGGGVGVAENLGIIVIGPPFSALREKHQDPPLRGILSGTEKDSREAHPDQRRQSERQNECFQALSHEIVPVSPYRHDTQRRESWRGTKQTMDDIESKLEGTLSLLGTVVVQRGRELKGEGQKVRCDGGMFYYYSSS